MKNRTESSYSLYRGKDERWCEPAWRVTGTLLNALLEVTWVPWQWKLQKKPCRIAQHHDSASLNNLRKGYLYTAKYRCNCIAYLQTNLNLFRNKRKWQHQPVLVVWKLSRIHRMIFSCSCLTKVLLRELVRLHWQRYSSTRHSLGFPGPLFCTGNTVKDTLVQTRKGASQCNWAMAEHCHCCGCEHHLESKVCCTPKECWFLGGVKDV